MSSDQTPDNGTATIYVVQPGDTLSGIAQSHGTTADNLARLNGLSNPARIVPGQRLIVARSGTCSVLPLFIDRDRNPIKGLEYQIECGPPPTSPFRSDGSGTKNQGKSKLNGLGDIVQVAENDLVRISVKAADGTWKLIHETVAQGQKLVTLASQQIKLLTQTRPHPQTPQQTPVSAPLSSRTPQPSPPGTPRNGTGPTQRHHAPGASNHGMHGQQTQTSNGTPLTSFSNDFPDLQPFFSHYTGDKITDEDWEAAASQVGCDSDIIKAFGIVECGGRSGFYKDNCPVILYERQVFSSHTDSAYDSSNADISGPAYKKGTHDKAGNLIPPTDRYVGTEAGNYHRLKEAYMLDADAAIQACSWGKFQVLGENWRACGFRSVQDFLTAACTSERLHLLELFVPFAKTKGSRTYGTLVDALKRKNWKYIAILYNGPKYWKDYAPLLKKRYEEIKTGRRNV